MCRSRLTNRARKSDRNTHFDWARILRLDPCKVSTVSKVLSVISPGIPAYWNQSSISVSEAADTLIIALRRDVPAEGEDDRVSEQAVNVTTMAGGNAITHTPTHTHVRVCANHNTNNHPLADVIMGER